MSAAPSDLDEALARLDRARTPRDLFGDDADEAARRYRRLARLVHPDATGRPTGAAFARLNALWRDYNRDCDDATRNTTLIRTRRHAYRLDGDPIKGDLAALYPARTETAPTAAPDVLLKMPRDPRDNDLVEREAEALRRLRTGDPKFRAYVPRLVESFRHVDASTGKRRQVNAIAALEGFHTLSAVEEAYPDGLDPRDAAWMWRRLLVGIGFAHRTGVLHGAVLPDHVMIHPEDHGLVLVGWCHSVTAPDGHDGAWPSGRVPAMVDRYADMYPPEVPQRLPASPATDVFMATRCMTRLMGDRAPRALRLFARGCTLPAANRRPADAWHLLSELDELLERLYGPRRFRPFHMPARR